MSPFSTLEITRDAAMEYVLRKKLQIDSDRKLKETVDDLLEDRLYNCLFVPDNAKFENQNHLL